MTSLAPSAGVGGLLREWRHRRHLSQLDLASEAEVSTRHLSFVETGRAAPSRDMLLRLAERLDAPLRARNELPHAGGFAATYTERPLDAPEMTAARRTVEAVLAAHAPLYRAAQLEAGVCRPKPVHTLLSRVHTKGMKSVKNLLRTGSLPKAGLLDFDRKVSKSPK